MRHTLWIVGLSCMVGLGLGLVAGCESEQRTDEPVNVTLMREYSPEADTVEVTLAEDRVAMPEIVGSGWTNFVVRNNDSMAHTFAIRGNGVERMLERIEPGQMQTMRIELRPGTYEVFCADCGSDTTRVIRRLTVAKW